MENTKSRSRALINLLNPPYLDYTSPVTTDYTTSERRVHAGEGRYNVLVALE